MNKLGLGIIIIGIIYLLYSILFKNKVNIYNKKSYYVVLDKHKFLKLQLYISIINSVCAILFGLVAYIYNLSNSYILLYPLVFHLINYVTILIGKRRQYIKYK